MPRPIAPEARLNTGIAALAVMALTAGFASLPTIAHADDDGVSGFIGAGVGVAPDFEGSEDYDIIPLAIGRVDYQGYGVELRGLGVGIDVLPSRQFDAGPILNFRGGRDDDVDNDVVASLREIDDAIELGGFLRYNMNPGFLENDRLSFEFDLLADVTTTHEGIVGSIGAAYNFRPMPKLGVTFDISTSFASDDYMDEYFSIDANNSARSGLRVFEADGGIKDVGIGTTLNYSITDNWGALLRVGYTELLSDAADSPIVDDEGSSSQFFAAVGISYRF